MRRSGLTFLGCDCASPPIGQALADSAQQVFIGAFEVAHLAGVVTEVELGAVAMQMLLADVVIGADDAALQEAEEAFHGVGVEHALAAIFA